MGNQSWEERVAARVSSDDGMRKCIVRAIEMESSTPSREDFALRLSKALIEHLAQTGWIITDDGVGMYHVIIGVLGFMDYSEHPSTPTQKCKNVNCNFVAMPGSSLPICEACDAMLRLVHAKMYGRPFEPKSTVDHLTLKLWEARAEKGGSPG